MNKGGGKPSGDFDNFTNRHEEQRLFLEYVNAPEGTTLPILMFYGIGGQGKSWLTRRLRERLDSAEVRPLPQSPSVLSARLDLEGQSGARYYTDPTSALGEIRYQLNIECPRFDLAFALLLFRQGVGAEPGHRYGGAFGTAYEFVKETGSAATSSIPGGNLIIWAGDKMTRLFGRAFGQTKLWQYVQSRAGGAEFMRLRGLDTLALYQELPGIFGEELEAHLPQRPGNACRAVVFIDTLEAARTNTLKESEQYDRVRWIGELYERTEGVLFVLAGRDRLRWAERDPDWETKSLLKQVLVGGLSEGDARDFLGKCGVVEGRMQRAILAVCVETEATSGAGKPQGYHALSLGLCADTVVNEIRAGKTPRPEEFDFAPGDYRTLATRFLRSLPDDTHTVWIERLALTPRFEEAAGRNAFSPVADAGQEAAWRRLQGYSFLRRAERDGWIRVHPIMAEAVEESLSAERRAATHAWWRTYWQSRRAAATDDYAALDWFHLYRQEPEQASAQWNVWAEAARKAKPPEMATHYRLLSWWSLTDLERAKPGTQEASFLNNLGVELIEASLGNRATNLARAIACYEAALRVYTEADFPTDWAMTQNNLGNAYYALPTGNREQNLARAIACYEAALRVRTEADFPMVLPHFHIQED